MHRNRLSFILLLLPVLIAFGCGVAEAQPPTTAPSAHIAAPPKPYLLHLPGIAGNRHIDQMAIRGIVEGGFTGDVDVYDWTENDPGMNALLAYQRNQKESKIIADRIADHAATHPGGKIYLLCHSGGGGLAVWALEKLPDSMKVDTVLMMSPALSPNYDLTKALRHVSGHVYVFSSLADIVVLSTGTKLFGTIDGVKTDAAGRIGFTMPDGADAEQYKKLVPMPFDPKWIELGNRGDHIGGMNRPFTRDVLTPLLLEGKMPPVSMPTTAETPTGLGREMRP